MEDNKLEMPSEGDVQSWKKEPNQPKLEYRSKAELTNKKEKRREEKIIKVNALRIEEDINKNVFLDYKNISGIDSNYKGKKGNIKKYNKNKRNRINNIKSIYFIIMLYFNLIVSNNIMIEYHFSNITLKVKGPGYSPILTSNFFNRHRPDIIYINGNKISSIAYAYTFSEINNTVNLIWNNSINNCDEMFRYCENIIEMD